MNNHPKQIQLRYSSVGMADWYNQRDRWGCKHRDYYVQDWAFQVLDNEEHVNSHADLINAKSDLFHKQGQKHAYRGNTRSRVSSILEVLREEKIFGVK